MRLAFLRFGLFGLYDFFLPFDISFATRFLLSFVGLLSHMYLYFY